MARTAFDEFFDQQMSDPAFAKAYGEARAEINSVDGFMRVLESARSVRGFSKAALARESQLRPQTVRRLFTDKQANPTIATVFSLLRPMGLGLQIVHLRKGATKGILARPATRARRAG